MAVVTDIRGENSLGGACMLSLFVVDYLGEYARLGVARLGVPVTKTADFPFLVFIRSARSQMPYMPASMQSSGIQMLDVRWRDGCVEFLQGGTWNCAKLLSYPHSK